MTGFSMGTDASTLPWAYPPQNQYKPFRASGLNIGGNRCFLEKCSFAASPAMFASASRWSPRRLGIGVLGGYHLTEGLGWLDSLPTHP